MEGRSHPAALAAVAAAVCLCVAGPACARNEPKTPPPATTETASTDAPKDQIDGNGKKQERSAEKENAAGRRSAPTAVAETAEGKRNPGKESPSSSPVPRSSGRPTQASTASRSPAETRADCPAGAQPSAALAIEGSRGFIVIDAGHGGRDGGARGGAGTNEKDVVLDVAGRTAELLRRKGVKVRLTREDDRYLSPEERAIASNAAAPDAFLSLHANSYTGRSASGVETWVAEPRFAPSTGAFTRSRKLAQAVQSALVKTMRARDRGVREGAFIVLRDAKVPAALAEIGFLSNRKEEAKLADPVWRARIAAAVSKAVLDSGVLVPQKK